LAGKMNKYFFILLFYLFSSSVFSQTTTADTLINQDVLQTDTLVKKTIDKGLNKIDKDQMRNNFNSFLQMQKERKAKENRQAYIRIGIDIAFLIVLVVGLMRRRKKSTR
jgi:hypothetical protein